MRPPSAPDLGTRLEPLLALLGEEFGPQGWWATTDPFEVIAAALLVQNTAWLSAAKALENLRVAGVLSVEGVLELDDVRLFELVRPSGFYRQKAAKLRAFATHVRNEHGGDLDEMLAADMEPLRRELLDIWGVGEETADTILMYAARQPSFIVDTYTQRTLERTGVVPSGMPRKELRVLLLDALPHDAAKLAEYHALFVRLGKAYCGSTPECEPCPLLLSCQYGSGVHPQ